VKVKSFFYGKIQKKLAMDLIAAEYLDGLSLPGVSNTPSQILHQNANIPNFLHIMIAFSLTYLYDDGAFLLFYFDNSIVKKEVARFFKNYKLKIKDEWTIINCLHLTNPMNPSKNVSSNFNLLFFGFDSIVIALPLISCILFNFNLILICRL